MNHRTNSGLEHLLGVVPSRSTLNTPSVPKFPAASALCPTSKHDAALSNTTKGSARLAERLQPRFNLVVTHVGIDEEELGALSDMHGVDALPETRIARRGPSSP
ncbi:MAG TPA: hypothetical protein VKA54_03395 [Gemmatimonadaceae bacterium]|nr:hypothetical protein [Gemmatimonadaceae bacterium]